MKSELNSIFTAIQCYLENKSYMHGIISRTNDLIQVIGDGYIAVFGLHSLRCTVITKANNTAITVSPIAIDTDMYQQSVGIVLSIFNENESTAVEFPSLIVDDGELFQISTVHNCDFDSVVEILPKYMEVLESMKNRVRDMSMNDSGIEEAQTNINKALLEYEARM